MSAAHMTTPCANCPYRQDAPRRHWSREEFENVVMADEDAANGGMGSTFACHKHIALPANRRGFCAGWALDQRKRGIPSIALRILLCTNKEARAAFDRLSDGGHKMFATVGAMCRANGVRGPRRPASWRTRIRRPKTGA